VQYLERGGDKPLLIKSPGHTFRMRAILNHFPAARVVWMTRDSTQTYRSNIKMWQSMFRLYGMTAVEPRALERFLAMAMRRSADMLDECAIRLHVSRLVVVRQSALMADPLETVANLCLRLGIMQSLDADRMLETIARLGTPVVDSNYTELPDDVSEAAARLDAAQDAAIRSHGIACPANA
jgi:hypothetical protein